MGSQVPKPAMPTLCGVYEQTPMDWQVERSQTPERPNAVHSSVQREQAQVVGLGSQIPPIDVAVKTHGPALEQCSSVQCSSTPSKQCRQFAQRRGAGDAEEEEDGGVEDEFSDEEEVCELEESEDDSEDEPGFEETPELDESDDPPDEAPWKF